MIGFLTTAFGKAVLGSVLKMVSNYINHSMQQKTERQQHDNAQDAEILKARIALAKENNKDIWGKVSRTAIFIMIIGTFCYLMIHYAMHPEIQYEILVPGKEHFFNPSGWKVFKLSGGFLAWQCVELCFLVVGFFCVPSKRR